MRKGEKENTVRTQAALASESEENVREAWATGNRAEEDPGGVWSPRRQHALVRSGGWERVQPLIPRELAMEATA